MSDGLEWRRRKRPFRPSASQRRRFAQKKMQPTMLSQVSLSLPMRRLRLNRRLECPHFLGHFPIHIFNEERLGRFPQSRMYSPCIVIMYISSNSFN